MKRAVRFQAVSKKFRIRGSHYRSLREDLMYARDALARGTRVLAGAGPGNFRPRHRFWVLRVLNLEIMLGERVGIARPNGAGKTTALRLMARITTATDGSVEVRGKVAALIQIGAGVPETVKSRGPIRWHAEQVSPVEQ